MKPASPLTIIYYIFRLLKPLVDIMKNSTQIRKRRMDGKSPVSNEHNHLRGKGHHFNKKLLQIITLLMSILILSFSLIWLNHDASSGIVDHYLSGETVYNITCQPQRINEYSSCSPTKCARIVVNEFLSVQQSSSLLKLVQKALSYGRSHGGASIFDVHSGTISKGNKFVNIYSLHAINGEHIFNSTDFITFHQVEEMVLFRLSNYYGINSNKLYLTSPSFFSEITPRPSQTIHDEYWHTHIDKETYEAFEYTSLVYLSEFEKDFKGGRFIYEKNGIESGLRIRPQRGLLSIFTSGKENPHRVEKVTEGVRYALTLGFTCDSDKRVNEM